MIHRYLENTAARVAGLIIGGMALSSCGQAILSAPDGTTLQIFVNPSFINANGDSAVVSVLAIEQAGTPVPDGTVIQFFTTLGKIQEQAKTNDGVARVNLISDARNGTAIVTAASGAVTVKSDNIVIGASRVSTVRTVAIDPTIDLKQGKSTARIAANVFDDKGNAIPGIYVRFTITNNPATDHLINGSDVVTDNSGTATNSVQTNRKTAGTITIKVEVLAPFTGTISDITVQVLDGTS